MSQSSDVTGLLLRWNSGDRGALGELTPLVYEELHQLARSAMRRERSDHTLQATALVNEAYMKLVDQRRANWQNRSHFFGAAARIMRRILVDHAKKHSAAKRGGSAEKIAMTDEVAFAMPPEDLIQLDECLSQLHALDPRKVQVVEMKFFAGMTNDEVAIALSTSGATVERDWKMARAWLLRAMGGPSPSE